MKGEYIKVNQLSIGEEQNHIWVELKDVMKVFDGIGKKYVNPELSVRENIKENGLLAYLVFRECQYGSLKIQSGNM